MGFVKLKIKYFI